MPGLEYRKVKRIPTKFHPFQILGDPYLVVPDGREPWSFQLSDFEKGFQHSSIYECYRHNPRKYHEKEFAYSVGSAGYDKLNNFIVQIQNYDYIIICAPLS